jgi:hypothetical protein
MLFGKYVISLRKHNQLLTKHFHAPSRLETSSYIKNMVVYPTKPDSS